MLPAITVLAVLTLGGVPPVSSTTHHSAVGVVDARIGSETQAAASMDTRLGDRLEGLAARRAAFDRAVKDLGGAPEFVLHAEDSKASNVPIRLYRPGEGRVPALIFIHGGLEVGGLDSHDAALRLLANRCHCVIISVGYRLAPEHKHPAQLDDAYAALRWAAESAKALEVQPDQFAVAGDGAGGNLAALVALRARDEGGPKIVYQALLYPATDLSRSRESSMRIAGSHGIGVADEINALRSGYLPAGLDPKDPSVSPLFADLKGLPPAFIANAEFDGYREEGHAYAAKLRASGVPAERRVYAGQTRGFFLTPGKVQASRQLIDDVAARLRRAFGYVE
jgi:acetyl esterase